MSKKLEEILSLYKINHRAETTCRCIHGAVGHLKLDIKEYINTHYIPRDEVEEMIPLYQDGHYENDRELLRREGRNKVLREIRDSLEAYKTKEVHEQTN